MNDETKQQLKDKLTSGSSVAGFTLIMQGVMLLIASHGADVTGWGMVFGGIGAVLRP